MLSREGGPFAVTVPMKACALVVAAIALLSSTGCHVFPQLGYEPMYHNPFPQLSKVAVAPFFNLSTEPSVDGRQFAECYGNELQAIPGYEVVPVGVVERAMDAHNIDITSPEQARVLAQKLGVDAIVIGAVTEFTPYYPPRCGLQIEWYAANPFFHPIPPGYGLPWGTPEEKEIPEPLVLETEMALAREQLKTQTPPYGMGMPIEVEDVPLQAPVPLEQAPEEVSPPGEAKNISHEEPVPCPPGQNPAGPPGAAPGPPKGHRHAGRKSIFPKPFRDDPESPIPANMSEASIPSGWPDERGLFPPPPTNQPFPFIPSKEPVLRHMAIYDGADGEFTNSLSNYYFFRSDDRGSNWRGYLTRMPDFIRFCCYHHITEMISARGGVDEARVVWQWYKNR